MFRVTAAPLIHGTIWSFTGKEHYNFTYDLQPRNLQHLAAFISTISGIAVSQAECYLNEILHDDQLKEHVRKLTQASPERHVAENVVKFGRRVGWYALVRAAKPKLVVETGVDKGLGSVVLAAALLRNAHEGHPGQLMALDINPMAGYLLKPPYTTCARLVINDSLATLRDLEQAVDFFIHDSDHNAAFEAAEYQAVSSRLANHALVLSDNAEHTDELIKFARASNRNFLFFSERPLNHWWPGEGIGIAYHGERKTRVAS